MQFAIICSTQDFASLNIKEHLLQLAHWDEIEPFRNHPVYQKDNCKLYTIDERLVTAENLDKEIFADVFIFASRHRSQKQVPALCAHVIGNWGSADAGGVEKTVVQAPAVLLKQAYLALKEHQEKLPDHQITMEATHHGPYLKKPTLFIEIGSNEVQWKHKPSGEIVANAILKIMSESLSNQKIAIGLGGPHYCNNFNKLVERTDYAVGHVCPKHHLEFLDDDLLKEAMQKTGASTIILDWKGLGLEKDRVRSITEGFEILRVQNLLKD